MKLIADYLGLKPQVLTSWLTVLSNLRNMCCHLERVWNRDFMLNPAEPRKMSSTWIDTSTIDKKKVFYRLCIIKNMLAFVSPNNNFGEKLSDLLGQFLLLTSPQWAFVQIGRSYLCGGSLEHAELRGSGLRKSGIEVYFVFPFLKKC